MNWKQSGKMFWNLLKLQHNNSITTNEGSILQQKVEAFNN
jgi:hypothetical protein